MVERQGENPTPCVPGAWRWCTISSSGARLRATAPPHEAPHTFFRCGERVLPVFCTREAARRVIASRALDEGWYARGFSGGELISLLFALHEGVAWVVFSPLPGHLAKEDALCRVVGRDDLIASLILT